MICVDLIAKILDDLRRNPSSDLGWVVEYATNMNVSEPKAVDLCHALRCLMKREALSLDSCRRVWDAEHLSACIGNSVDSECKAVFNGTANELEVGPVSRLVLSQLRALLLVPICGGLKVAGLTNPDAGSLARGVRTYHNGCTRGCVGLVGEASFYTEVDLVACDTMRNPMVLLKLKTRNKDVLDDATLWRYNTQLWLTWTMFSLTYPSVAERTCTYLIIVRPGTKEVILMNCFRPSVTHALRTKFPWLSALCQHVLNCLTPGCVNMRVGSRESRGSRPNPDDLVYRNILFNEIKLARLGRIAGGSGYKDKRSPVPGDVKRFTSTCAQSSFPLQPPAALSICEPSRHGAQTSSHSRDAGQYQRGSFRTDQET